MIYVFIFVYNSWIVHVSLRSHTKCHANRQSRFAVKDHCTVWQYTVLQYSGIQATYAATFFSDLPITYYYR